MIPAVIDRLSRQFPRMVFTVKQAATIPSLYADLRERRVDFILGRMMAPIEHEELNAEILLDDPLIIVAGSRSKWLRRRKIDPAEIVALVFGTQRATYLSVCRRGLSFIGAQSTLISP